MDPSDASQDLDGDVLGDDIGRDGLPGIGDYPPDRPYGVDDPNLEGDDDVELREERHRRDDEDDDADDRGIDLLPPDEDDDLMDGERQQIAGEGTPDEEVDVPAEVAAVHVRDEVRDEL